MVIIIIMVRLLEISTKEIEGADVDKEETAEAIIDLKMDHNHTAIITVRDIVIHTRVDIIHNNQGVMPSLTVGVTTIQ